VGGGGGGGGGADLSSKNYLVVLIVPFPYGLWKEEKIRKKKTNAGERNFLKFQNINKSPPRQKKIIL
jgi:hypothetical protein